MKKISKTTKIIFSIILVLTLISSSISTIQLSSADGAVCGDGKRTDTEECDNTDFNQQTCKTLGFTGGKLKCTTECTLDTTECTKDAQQPAQNNAQAGNQVIQTTTTQKLNTVTQDIDSLTAQIDALTKIANRDAGQNATLARLQSQRDGQIKTKSDLAKQDAKEMEAGKRWFGQDTADLIFTAFSGIYSGIFTYSIVHGAGDCAAEKPFLDTAACSSCNEDPYRICTKERCQILGKCIALPIKNLSLDEKIKLAEGTQGYRCIPGKCEETSLVGFTKMNVTLTLSEGTSGKPIPPKDQRSNPGSIKIDAGEIGWNTRMIEITVETDQLASCRYIIDKINANYSEMTNFEDNDYPQDIVTLEQLPQKAIILIPGDLTRDENHTVYIKCSNACGVTHNEAYDHNQFRFRFEKKPDQLPPVITFIDPANNAVLRDDLTKANMTLWLDENGNCAYSTKVKNYSYIWQNMTEMTEAWKEDPDYATKDTPVIRTKCTLSQECLDLKQNKCAHCFVEFDLTKGFEQINWTGLPEDIQRQIEPSGLYNTTKMFRLAIRCQDNSTQKNKMPEEDTLNYIFMTMPGYDINITKPEQEQKSYDDTPEIEATSGLRDTKCKYKIVEGNSNTNFTWNQMTLIDEVLGTIHDGEHNVSLNGTNLGKLYTIHVLCRDTWNMEARDKVNFFILKDTKAPILIRTYKDTSGSFLTIETDEESSCTFSHAGCNFNFSKGEAMMGDNEYLHTTYWKDKTFFIKCVDKWGNYPPATVSINGSGIGSKDPMTPYCTAILKPFEIPSIG